LTDEHLTKRRSWAWISEALWREWDPIGCGVPSDEYDAYVPRIIRLLEAGADVDQIAAYLADTRENIVGERNLAEDRRVAQLLYDHLYI
jgi:hypothetical protein